MYSLSFVIDERVCLPINTTDEFCTTISINNINLNLLLFWNDVADENELDISAAPMIDDTYIQFSVFNVAAVVFRIAFLKFEMFCNFKTQEDKRKED